MIGYNPKKDEVVERLRANGPSSIKYNIQSKTDAIINGPLSIRGGSLTAHDTIKIHGPLTITKGGSIFSNSLVIDGPISFESGTIEIETDCDINGPFSTKEGTLKVGKKLDINGPLSGLGVLDCQDAHINGPASFKHEINVEDLHINGPLSSQKDIKGRKLEIRGPVKVDGSIEASQQVIIKVKTNTPQTKPLVKCKMIQAPHIEIVNEGTEKIIVEANLTGEKIKLVNIIVHGNVEGELENIESEIK